MIQTTRDDFEVWLADMDDALERFKDQLPDDVRSRLDYSADSLDVVESWILSHYQDNLELLDRKESTSLDGLSRYVGEVFRKNLRAKWDIELKNQKDAYFGLPKLVGYSDSLNAECPLSLVTASANRRKGTFLSSVLRNMMKRFRPKQK